MSYKRKKRKLTAEINVVPYIDVMLVLLIIFMVTAPYVTQGVDVNLPKTETAKTAAELSGNKSDASFIIVEVTKNGSVGLSIDNEPVERDLTKNEIYNKVKQVLAEKPDSTVLVGGDSEAQYADIVTVMDELRQVGVKQVGLMTDLINKKA